MRVEIVATISLSDRTVENRVLIEVSDQNDIRVVMPTAIDALQKIALPTATPLTPRQVPV